MLVRTAQRQARVQLEMGGKNPLVVLDDAELETAVGLRAERRLLLHRSALHGILAADRHGGHPRALRGSGLVERMQSLVVDHALKPGTQMGPVVDDSQLEQDLMYIEIGRSEGAEMVTGGVRLERETEGYYLAPTLFTQTHNAMRINREEVFGPDCRGDPPCVTTTRR